VAWFGNGAVALAQRALDKADQVAESGAATRAAFESHMAWCERRDKEKQADEKEWREGLGKRIDRWDRLMWSMLVAVILLLLNFILPHLPLTLH
jgi:hypothetical protein